MLKNSVSAIIGIVLGFIAGFLLTNNIAPAIVTAPLAPDASMAASSGSGVAPPLDPSQVGGALPPNHPGIGTGTAATGSGATTNTTTSAAATSADAQRTMAAADGAPKDFDKQMEAAIAFYQAGDYAKATFYLERAVKINPRDVDALVALGNTRYDAEDYVRAAEIYERALALKPANADVRTDLGNTYFIRQPPDYPRAIAEYRRSLQIDARHEKTLQNLALALIRTNDKAAARQTIDQLAAINAQNPAIASLRTQAGE